MLSLLHCSCSFSFNSSLALRLCCFIFACHLSFCFVPEIGTSFLPAPAFNMANGLRSWKAFSEIDVSYQPAFDELCFFSIHSSILLLLLHFLGKTDSLRTHAVFGSIQWVQYGRMFPRGREGDVKRERILRALVPNT
ncbi:hypothetical protein B0F90DRAFT_1736199, partial [Multifurca ochricompacta]